MIIGLGTDIQDIVKMNRMLTTYGKPSELQYSRFFSDEEREYCNNKHVPITHFTGLWCAKEAWLKASGKLRTPLNQVVIRHSKEGKPSIVLPEELQVNHEEILVTISHSASYATATVIIQHRFK